MGIIERTVLQVDNDIGTFVQWYKADRLGGWALKKTGEKEIK